jgi:hypothetical protein
MFEYYLDVPLNELYEYLKDLNFSDNSEIDLDYNFVEVNLDVAKRILDSHISASEIEEIELKLPNCKAPGIDYIKNEYIKNTIRLVNKFSILFYYMMHGQWVLFI